LMKGDRWEHLTLNSFSCGLKFSWVYKVIDRQVS
jgi:hypothetical protein